MLASTLPKSVVKSRQLMLACHVWGPEVDYKRRLFESCPTVQAGKHKWLCYTKLSGKKTGQADLWKPSRTVEKGHLLLSK